MNIFSDNPIPKAGLLIGVVLGVTLLNYAKDIPKHISVIDLNSAKNTASVIDSYVREEPPTFIWTFNPFNQAGPVANQPLLE